MFTTLNDFTTVWSQELESTNKLLKQLTDKSLAQAVTPEGRTLGRLAWHLVLTIPEMMERTGLHMEGPAEETPVPASANEIASTYDHVASTLLKNIQKEWSDATLQQEDDMYGERWKRGATLLALVLHQSHHRGQMTVLMRQAGLKIPGLVGPTREEWAAFGMQPPKV